MKARSSQLRNHELFATLTAEQLDVLTSLSEVVSLPAAETFVREGETPHEFYYIEEGSVEVLKTSTDGHAHRLARVEAGGVVGELALIEESKRSATLRTIEPTTLTRFPRDAIRKRDDLYAALTATMATMLSKRLHYTNEVTVRSMQAQLATAKDRIAQGVVMVTLVLGMTIYIVMQGIIVQLKEYIPNTTFVSIGALLLFALITVVALKRTGYNMSSYGFTLENWPRVTTMAVLYSLPVMAAILLSKWVVISSVPALADEPLIRPFAVLTTAKVANPWSYFLIPLAYTAFCPIQEFVFRGAIQGSFQRFLKSERHARTWTAILVANLLFAATHMHTTFGFAIAVFLPGLFWGWLYAKQGSLLGVSVSHIVIGFWAVFIMSFSHMI